MRTLLALLLFISGAVAVCQVRPLQPGDLLRIRCNSDPTYSTFRRIDVDGRIRIAAISLRVAGKSIADLAEALGAATAIDTSSFDIVLLPSRSQCIRIIGPPVGELLVPYRSPLYLKDVLRLAFRVKNEDTDRVRVETALGESIDFEVEVNSTGAESNPSLAPGDSVYLLPASGPAIVAVLGSVKTASPVRYRPGMSAADALELAGGLSNTADEANLHIVRKGAELPAFSLAMAGDMTLRRGDSLVVAPSSVRRYVTIVGEVLSGGLLPWRAGMTLEQAIQLAGGFTTKAGTTAVRWRRMLGATPFSKVVRFDQVKSQVLEPGDVLQVPLIGAQQPRDGGASGQPIKRVVPPR